MSRPKGSKNKKKNEKILAEPVKNKKLSPDNDSKQDLISSRINIKEIKSEIRRLRKIKLSCRAGAPERLDLGRQIKELKEQLTDRQAVNKDKEKIIIEILKYKPDYIKACNIDYSKFTVEQLKKNLERIKK